jgi:hypothetical protein
MQRCVSAVGATAPSKAPADGYTLMVSPAGTPEDILQKLSESVLEAYQFPEDPTAARDLRHPNGPIEALGRGLSGGPPLGPEVQAIGRQDARCTGHHRQAQWFGVQQHADHRDER